ncbi:MAG: hypothetical protein HQK63_05820 [Desulfamplus sp.]|nr:hypothetical protein [Desulfamplus sp.]
MQQAIQNTLRSCVSADGQFIVGIHRPAFNVELLRKNSYVESLGKLPDGTVVKNEVNFPCDKVEEPEADVIYEIPNAFPFRGTTYINSAWADKNVGKPEKIDIPKPSDCSLSQTLKNLFQKKLNEENNEQQNKKGKEEQKKEHQEKVTHTSFMRDFFTNLPYPIKIALAQSSTDPDDLLAIIPLCCTIIFDKNGVPSGLMFKKGINGDVIPDIHDHTLFEIIVNNPYLPDTYKRVMVLKPGIQGKSEITGEWLEYNELDSSLKNITANSNEDIINNQNKNKSHVFEYLRRNSYIPWGHFAANTADDTVRYSVNSLTMADMAGMRHLYYQRTYLRLAEQLNISFSSDCRTIPPDNLEQLRLEIIKTLQNIDHKSLEKNDEHKIFETNSQKNFENNNQPKLSFNGSLWGWNFGFGYAQSGYRLHASHQQIHQQYAMIPKEIKSSIATNNDAIKERESQVINQAKHKPFLSFACGDMIADFIESYKNITGKPFFDSYIKAIRTNKRIDIKEDNIHQNTMNLPSSLIVYEDDNIMLFVPKAQTSQWELQLMAIKECGNILEANTTMRASLDKAILTALKILENMGASMVTSIEFSKRFDSNDKDQRLLYSFMPKMPDSPGAFSEAQLRWINGHYPEDFAYSCRIHYEKFIKSYKA